MSPNFRLLQNNRKERSWSWSFSDHARVFLTFSNQVSNDKTVSENIRTKVEVSHRVRAYGRHFAEDALSRTNLWARKCTRHWLLQWAWKWMHVLSCLEFPPRASTIRQWSQLKVAKSRELSMLLKMSFVNWRRQQERERSTCFRASHSWADDDHSNSSYYENIQFF